ncbi:MAG: SPOR domain-containing protein [Myxococcales bacterium]
MRDEHRFHEKIELSLEKRHVASIGIAVSLFLVVAFSLGVLVGKRLASRAAVPGAVDDLAALDAQQAPGQGRAWPPAVRGEVTRPGTGNAAPRAADPVRVADLALAAPAPAARSEATVPDEATRPGTGTGTPAQTTRPGTGTGTAAQATHPGTGTGTAAQATRPGTGTGSAVRSIAQPPDATTVPPGRRTAEVAAPQTAVLPAPPANLGKYTVQIGATQDRAEAHQMVIRVSKAGLRPYVMEAKLPGRGLWYRVRIGAFADRAAADQYRRDVERELRTAAVVMPSG